MGIKHLWTILAPFCDRKPLYELQGKTVAVDLSCWICEAQNIADYQVQPRMYLRNLYFRTCYLLLMDVNLVFVLEGKAPQLKYDTITARNAMQFKGAKPKTSGVKTGKDRTRFHFVLRQCEEMLGYMGIACIKGKGEAESLCAYLNEAGLVDGCISQDSDCFAYGAQVVYRNFSISTQGTQSASGGAVDVYDIRKAERSLNFGRNKIVAMALLVGSDYSEGVYGVGKDSVLKFFETVSNEDVLNRLRSWRTNTSKYQDYERQLNDKNICTSCGHNGKIQSHTKMGCISCKTSKGCNSLKYKEERLNMKTEVTMRTKALQDTNFPDEELIKEFLYKKDNVKELELTWKKPDIVQFMKFTTKFLQWEELYAFEKFLPVLTRWQCRNAELLKEKGNLKGVLIPERIKKVRNPKGVPSYEIIWSDPNNCFKGLIPEHQISDNNIDKEKLWSTIEPQNLVDNAYPDLVEAFKQSKIKPKKVSKRKKKNQDNVECLAEKLDNVSISEPVLKKVRKPRAAKNKKNDTNGSDDLNSSLKLLSIDDKIPKIRTLDNFVKKAVSNSQNQKLNIKNNYSTPVKPTQPNIQSFDPDLSGFGDESDTDLSDIIDGIISRKSLAHNLKTIADKYVDNEDQIICLDDSSDNNGCASFFMQNPADTEDLFEKTFNNTFKNFGGRSSSDSDTEEYDLGDLKENCDNVSSDDSFCDTNYVPLIERLRAKCLNK